MGESIFWICYYCFMFSIMIGWFIYCLCLAALYFSVCRFNISRSNRIFGDPDEFLFFEIFYLKFRYIQKKWKSAFIIIKSYSWIYSWILKERTRIFSDFLETLWKTQSHQWSDWTKKAVKKNVEPRRVNHRSRAATRCYRFTIGIFIIKRGINRDEPTDRSTIS